MNRYTYRFTDRHCELEGIFLLYMPKNKHNVVWSVNLPVQIMIWSMFQVGTVYQLVITISILVSQILGLESILGTEDSWPVLLAITAIPGIFQLVTLPICPESPKYLLLSKGQEMEAQRGNYCDYWVFYLEVQNARQEWEYS
jgi:hypothetical protein